MSLSSETLDDFAELLSDCGTMATFSRAGQTAFSCAIIAGEESSEDSVEFAGVSEDGDMVISTLSALLKWDVIPRTKVVFQGISYEVVKRRRTHDDSVSAFELRRIGRG